MVLSKEFINDHTTQQHAVEDEFELAGSDLSSFNNIMGNINTHDTDQEFEVNLNKLPNQIPSYSISKENKTKFINSLGILKYSYFLWWVG